MLWIAKDELAVKREQPYDARFLNISDPRADNRLKSGTGTSRLVFTMERTASLGQIPQALVR